MTHLMLVHGAWHGPWCWERLLPLVQRPGLTCHAPCLAGLAERQAEASDLDTHVREVGALIEAADLHDVVLVGHSYAGIVVSVVAAAMPGRVRTLVYLDSFVPEPDRCLYDLIDPAEAAKLRAVAAQRGGLIPPFPPAAYGVHDPADAAWLQARLTPMPGACFEQPARFDARRLAAVRPVYVRATHGGVPDRFARFARRFEGRDDAGYHEVPSGHDMMLTHAPQVAALLLAECTPGA
jgi:pimeloyl-ACP methyl ester carboxylesterase